MVVRVYLTPHLFLPVPLGALVAVGESVLCVSWHAQGEIRSLALISPPCFYVDCVQAVIKLFIVQGRAPTRASPGLKTRNFMCHRKALTCYSGMAGPFFLPLVSPDTGYSSSATLSLARLWRAP